MLSDAAQQSLPQDAQVALQQVDNCKSSHANAFAFAQCETIGAILSPSLGEGHARMEHQTDNESSEILSHLCAC